MGKVQWDYTHDICPKHSGFSRCDHILDIKPRVVPEPVEGSRVVPHIMFGIPSGHPVPGASPARPALRVIPIMGVMDVADIPGRVENPTLGFEAWSKPKGRFFKDWFLAFSTCS